MALSSWKDSVTVICQALETNRVLENLLCNFLTGHKVWADLNGVKNTRIFFVSEMDV